MAGTRTSDISRFLQNDIRLVSTEVLKMPMDTYYDKYSTKFTTSKKTEKYDTISNIDPAQEKIEGGSIHYSKQTQGYQTSITNKTYADGFQFSLESDKYELYGVIDKTKVTEVRRSLLVLKEENIANVWNTVSSTTGADGVTLANASHPLLNTALLNDNLASGVFSNDNYKTARNKFNRIKNHAGKRFDTKPNKLLIHEDKEWDVSAIFQSTLLANELSNTKNTLPKITPVYSCYVTPALTTSATYPWWLIDDKIDSVVYQERQGMTFGADNDKHDTLEYYVFGYEMYGMNCINPGFGYVYSPGS